MLSAGMTLGPYEIVAPLGAGGMGEVYRATDTKLKRQVAIKVLPAALTADHDRLVRFQREAEVLASLNHPHIAAIYGLEDADGVRALVMELVDGPTLADRIAQGAIPLDEALPIAKQIAEALEAAHEQGIVHRDLKPANIKVRPDGTVKVLDFGLAKAMEPTSASSANAMNSPTISMHATQAGIILGTAAYMSPEQTRGGTVDRRADIWAFGVVLYEMLTGRRLFDGATVSDTLAHVLMKDPDWTALPANTPAPIRRLLRRCLEKDRKRRLADIADARMEIEDARSEPEPAFRPAPAPARHRAHRVLWIFAPLTLVAFLSALVPTVLYFRRATPEPVVTRLDVVTPSTTDAFSFALSPDGRQLAFVANGEKGSQLWLRPLDQVAAQPLAGTDGASFPFWAPDNRAIGFFADSKLKRLDLAGGAPQVLADAIVPRGGTWNRDGIIVFAPLNTGGLMRVGATGGTPVPVTRPAAGQGSHRWPQFLPDGRRVLFLAATGPVLDNMAVTAQQRQRSVDGRLRGPRY